MGFGVGVGLGLGLGLGLTSGVGLGLGLTSGVGLGLGLTSGVGVGVGSGVGVGVITSPPLVLKRTKDEFITNCIGSTILDLATSVYATNVAVLSTHVTVSVR